jgi:hypothetical protein
MRDKLPSDWGEGWISRRGRAMVEGAIIGGAHLGDLTVALLLWRRRNGGSGPLTVREVRRCVEQVAGTAQATRQREVTA